MSLRRIFTLLGLIAILVIGYFNWDEIRQAWQLVKTADWPVLLGIPICLAITFYSHSRFYQHFYGLFGYKVKLAKLYKLNLALNFVNQVSPSAGVTAVSYTSYILKRKVPSGKVTLVQYGRYALLYVSFLVILLAGIGFLYFGGGIDKIAVRIIVVVASGVLALAAILLFLINSQQHFDSVIYWLQRAVDRVSGWFRRGKPLIGHQRIRSLLVEFHEGLEFIVKNRRRLLAPFTYALLANLSELTAFYLVFIALGITINPGAAILAYAAANGIGIISLVPGDVGPFELTMVAALSSTGVPVSVGLGATVLYRVVNKSVLLPVGFYYYSRLLNGKVKNAGPNLKRR